MSLYVKLICCDISLFGGELHDQQEGEGIVSKTEGVSVTLSHNVSVTISQYSHLEMMTHMCCINSQILAVFLHGMYQYSYNLNRSSEVHVFGGECPQPAGSGR